MNIPKDMTLVIRTLSYSGDGASGHHIDRFVMTNDEADNWVGTMEQTKPYVKLDWKKISERSVAQKLIAYNIGRVITVGQHDDCYSGERELLDVQTTLLD